jgi:hypothetical protein
VAIRKQADGLPLNITILQVLYFATVCAHHPLLLQDELGKNSPNSPVFEECFFLTNRFQQIPNQNLKGFLKTFISGL